MEKKCQMEIWMYTKELRILETVIMWENINYVSFLLFKYLWKNFVENKHKSTVM